MRDAAREASSGAGAVAADQPRRLAEGREGEEFGFSCCHSSPAFSPIDADAQAVLVPGATWLHQSMPLRAGGEAQHHVGVVVEPPARHEGVQVGGQVGDLVAGDEVGEVVGMGADVADRAGGAGARRIGAPLGLLVAGLLERW